jgi:hypothetical protein
VHLPVPPVVEVVEHLQAGRWTTADSRRSRVSCDGSSSATSTGIVMRG